MKIGPESKLSCLNEHEVGSTITKIPKVIGNNDSEPEEEANEKEARLPLEHDQVEGGKNCKEAEGHPCTPTETNSARVQLLHPCCWSRKQADYCMITCILTSSLSFWML